MCICLRQTIRYGNSEATPYYALRHFWQLLTGVSLFFFCMREKRALITFELDFFFNVGLGGYARKLHG